MKTRFSLGILLMGAMLVLAPAGYAQNRARNRNLNISSQGDAQSCADLRVTSDGQLAQTAEKFTLQRAEAPVLSLNAAERGVISVRGWNQNFYSVEACKIAVADDRGAAERALTAIAVSRTAGQFSFTGPQGDDTNWQVHFIVHTPPNASIDVEGKNAPISVADVSGTIKARATNGPLSFRNCSGSVDAQTKNGPISFAGDGGEVKLQADNGPISVKVSKPVWNGSLLDARTTNGPMSLMLPAEFQSGIRVESNGRSPMSCRHEACNAALKNLAGDKQTLQMNGSNETIRVSTNNGPISVGSEKKIEKIL